MLREAVSSAKGLLLLIVAVTLLAVALSSKDSHAPRQQMAEPKLRQTSVEIAPNVFLPMVSLGQSMSHKAWFQLGGRGADTAYDYGDQFQEEIGKAIRSSNVSRGDVFVTTKVPCCPADFWCSTGDSDASGPRWWQWPAVGPDGGDGAVLAESDLMRLAEHNLEKMGLEYVDLLILHFPCSSHEKSLMAYRVLEEFQRRGKARAIGVSNFDAVQLEALVRDATVKPAINQIGLGIGKPYSPWLKDDEYGLDPFKPRSAPSYGTRAKATLAKTRELGVHPMAWGPLGVTTLQLMEYTIGNPVVLEIAKAHGKSGAQVALRWLVQQGVPIITSGNNPAHFVEDIAVTDFELSEGEMDRITALSSA